MHTLKDLMSAECDINITYGMACSGVGKCFSMGGLQLFKDTELNFQHITPFDKDKRFLGEQKNMGGSI